MKQFDFIIIGASKCGTTTIYDALNRHPEVAMCPVKEPFIFSFASWEERLEEFAPVKTSALRGEASPIYAEIISNPRIPRRIYQHNKDTKIILIVREPFSRLRSVWIQTLSTEHHLRSGYANKTDVNVPPMPSDFEEAVFKYPAYVDACRYKKIYEAYREYFAEKQIHLCFFDDLSARPDTFYAELFEFLNLRIGSVPSLGNIISNKSEGKKVINTRGVFLRNLFKNIDASKCIPPSFKNYLRQLFYKEIKSPVVKLSLKNKIKEELMGDVRFVLVRKPDRLFRWKEWED